MSKYKGQKREGGRLVGSECISFTDIVTHQIQDDLE